MVDDSGAVLVFSLGQERLRLGGLGRRLDQPRWDELVPVYQALAADFG
ncbi:MAG: hypothetical protein ACLPSM_12830 [Acidimicrobiales bacterium]|jgi:hypothetical protein